MVNLRGQEAIGVPGQAEVHRSEDDNRIELEILGVKMLMPVPSMRPPCFRILKIIMVLIVPLPRQSLHNVE